MLVDAVHAEAVELEEHTHPLGVALGQIVVDGHHVHTLAGQSVEVDRQRGHQRLALARGHLGNLAAVEYHATDNLHVVVHHVPGDLVAAGHPVVPVESLVALDGDGRVRSREVAVVVCGGNLHRLVLRKTLGGLLHHSEGLGQNLIEHLLRLVVARLFQFVDALVEVLLFIDGHVVFVLDAAVEGGQLGLFLLHGLGNTFLEFNGFRSQGVVRKSLDGGVHRQSGVEEGFDDLQVALALVSEQFGQKISHVSVNIYIYTIINQIIAPFLQEWENKQRYNFFFIRRSFFSFPNNKHAKRPPLPCPPPPCHVPIFTTPTPCQVLPW